MLSVGALRLWAANTMACLVTLAFLEDSTHLRRRKFLTQNDLTEWSQVLGGQRRHKFALGPEGILKGHRPHGPGQPWGLSQICLSSLRALCGQLGPGHAPWIHTSGLGQHWGPHLTPARAEQGLAGGPRPLTPTVGDRCHQRLGHQQSHGSHGAEEEVMQTCQDPAPEPQHFPLTRIRCPQRLPFRGHCMESAHLQGGAH